MMNNFDSRKGLIGGGIFGVIYFLLGELTTPSNLNCSYLANPITDALATLGAIICIMKGLQYDDFLVSAFGICVLIIHLGQVVFKAGMF